MAAESGLRAPRKNPSSSNVLVWGEDPVGWVGFPRMAGGKLDDDNQGVRIGNRLNSEKHADPHFQNTQSEVM